MAKYRDNQGNVIEVGNPELNPQLTQGRTLVSETTPLGKINSTSLSQTPNINFQTQPTPQPYNIASLGSFTPMEATPQETQASELTKRIQQGNQQLAGQSEFRGQQEQQVGIQAMTQTQRDLESRFNALKNEALAIPLQVQQDFRGVGATRGGVQPIETAKLRENAIQALSVNSLLEASRGNLTLAQDMVDKAVAQKYDPIKEQIAINTANLDLIIKDPATSLQDKNRAEQQKLINEQRASVVAKQENDSKEILKIGTAVASAGAPATVIDQIQKAQSPMEALSLASPYLGLEQQLSNRLQEERIRTEQSKRGISGGMSGGVTGTDTRIPTKENLQSIIASYTSQKNVPAQLKQQLTKGLNIINKLDDIIAKNPKGEFVGASPLKGLYAKIAPEFMTPKSTTGFLADESKLRQDLTSYITGAAYTQLQEKDVNNIIPKTTLTDPKNQQRIEQLYNTIIGDIQSSLVASGFNAQLPRVSGVFSGTDKYAQYRNQLNEGEILVQRGNDVVAITPAELQAGDTEI